MIIANVANLKQRLSHYLRLVEGGDQIVVTSHRRRVARLVPDTDDELVVRQPLSPVEDLLPLAANTPVQLSRDVVEILLEDRRQR